jgi:hypothetical protein
MTRADDTPDHQKVALRAVADCLAAYAGEETGGDDAPVPGTEATPSDGDGSPFPVGTQVKFEPIHRHDKALTDCILNVTPAESVKVGPN